MRYTTTYGDKLTKESFSVFKKSRWRVKDNGSLDAEKYIKMQKGKTFEDVMVDPILMKKSEQISDILENVWNVGKLTNSEYDVFKEVIQTPAGRKLFRGQLNKYRISHRKMLNERSFKTLKRLLWLLLDKMRAQEINEKHVDSLEMMGRKASFVEDPARKLIYIQLEALIIFNKKAYKFSIYPLYVYQLLIYLFFYKFILWFQFLLIFNY